MNAALHAELRAAVAALDDAADIYCWTETVATRLSASQYWRDSIARAAATQV